MYSARFTLTKQNCFLTTAQSVQHSITQGCWRNEERVTRMLWLMDLAVPRGNRGRDLPYFRCPQEIYSGTRSFFFSRDIAQLLDWRFVKNGSCVERECLRHYSVLFNGIAWYGCQIEAVALVMWEILILEILML